MRISNSIIRNYLRHLDGNIKFNNPIDYIQAIKGNPSREQRIASFAHASSITYQDNSPYETLVKQQYLLLGQIYELLINGDMDRDRLVTFIDRRSKASQEDVKRRCEAIGPTALPISLKNLAKLEETASRTLSLYLDNEYREMTGCHTVAEFMSHRNTEFNVQLQSNLEVGQDKILKLTGECDGLHITDDGITFILEIKTSSKLYYPNGIRKLVDGNNYNFQVGFYHFLLTLIGHSVHNNVLFLMSNPARNVTTMCYIDVLEEDLQKSIYEVLTNIENI